MGYSLIYPMIWSDFKAAPLAVNDSYFRGLYKRQKEKVISDGQYSPFADIRASVPQGSTFGTLLFLIYNCNLSNYKKVNANRLLRYIFVFRSS